MIISAPKRTERQPLLFDLPLLGYARMRNVVGDLCDRLTAEMVGGVRHRTDCTADYCPDVSANGVFFESKAVGTSGTLFVYEGRREADCQFAREHRLVYVVWRHGAKYADGMTDGSCERAVVELMRAVYVVPHEVINTLLLRRRVDRLNSKYGSSDERPEYGAGRRLPLSALERWVHRKYNYGYEAA